MGVIRGTLELSEMKKGKISIAIPSNVLENNKDLRAKTQKIGQIARACVIYNVEQIIIYSINKNFLKKFSKDIDLISKILEYLDCPQYLRRLLFPKLPIFNFVGLLPPLRTPPHPIEKKISQILSGSIREGAVLFSNKRFSEIDIGLEIPIKVEIPNLPLKSRITLKLKKQGANLSGKVIKKTDIREYWGYNIKIFNDSILQFMEKFKNHIIIATSRQGNPLRKNDLENFQFTANNKILLLFGSPNIGLFEIYESNGLKLKEMVEFVLNIAPQQGTKTIRVEEAILSTLSIVSNLISL